MPKIHLAGRTDIEAFFKESGVFESERLTHHPFLAFVEDDEAIRVKIIENPHTLLSLPDETLVMGQWPGNWRSDYFQFTVAQYRQHVIENNKVLLSAKNVVKRVGKRGGFRLITYEYINESGAIRYASTSSAT